MENNGNPFGGFSAVFPRNEIPRIISTPFPREYRPNVAFRRSSLLNGRTKHRIFPKPYSSSVSTTLTPIKPLEPVIKIRSSTEAI